MMLLAVFLLLFFGYGLTSARLDKTVVTAPMLFTAAGMLACSIAPASLRGGSASEVFLPAAELGLVLLLFTDASRTDLSALVRARSLPSRLLGIGMLLTLLLGALLARWIFPAFTWGEAGVLAAILAPTDAGLGQVIVEDPRVPVRIRRALSVEAGLNDGLSVPFLLFFLALVETGTSPHHAGLLRLILEQLGYGVLVGLGIGLAGGLLLERSQRRGWTSPRLAPLAVVALPLLCLVVSEAVEASMFIAAFVAGLAVQVGSKAAGKHTVEFTEQWGQVVNLAVFFLFGLIAARAMPSVRAEHVAYAILSLTVVRMLPVGIALLGAGLHPATVLFLGWFGPRGLASIVLGLVYIEARGHVPDEDTIRLTVATTVLLSILAHGLTARPGIGLYVRRLDAWGPGAPEREAASAPDPSAVAPHAS